MNLNFKDGVIVRDSVATDIEPISKNMRIADIQEIWRSHGHTPLQSLTIAFYTSTLCYTVEHNNKRAAMFGVVPESFLGSRGSIWLLGTNDLAKIQRKLIRHSRSVIKYLLQHYQHLDNYVDVKNTLSIKWLRWCGAEIEEPKPFGERKELFHHFTFERKQYALAS